MALIREDGIVHGKGIVRWEDVTGARITRYEIAPQVTMPHAIKIRNRDFSGTIYLSKARGASAEEILLKHLEPQSLVILTITAADLAFLLLGPTALQWIAGPGSALVILGFLLLRRRPLQRFTWVDYLLVLEMVVGGVGGIMARWSTAAP